MSDDYVNLSEPGSIDPANVTRTAVESAVSVAGMIPTAEVLIADKPEPASNGAVPRPHLTWEWGSSQQGLPRHVTGNRLVTGEPLV